jgi:hypothetical protein
MDFSKVKIIEKANPRKPEVVKEKVSKPTFHLKVDYAKQKMIFSPVLFEQIQLEHNSLAQAIGPDGELLLLVMPGNTGVFAKTQAKGAKGRSFKNIKFVASLQEKGWNGGKFNLELLGEHEGTLYYSVVPFITDETEEASLPEGPQDDAEEATAEAEVSEDQVSFN